MAIREKSFRIGCGRYLQEPGIINTIGDEVLRLGKAPFVVGGKTALSISSAQIEESLKKTCERYRFEAHTGSCNEEDARYFADLVLKDGFDVIVGVGGGVIMDFAKMVAYFTSLPIINVPTSSATCAAYTPLSVMYTKDGRTCPSYHHKREVDAVLADTKIIATQPPRLLLAGVFDAMAKYIEIRHRYIGEGEDYPLGLDYAYVLAERTFSVLSKMTDKCLSDMENGILSDAVEELVFASIAATGVISGIARGSNQCALAHKFYEITRLLFNESAKPYLHGEIVGVGLLLQNFFNNEAERNSSLIELMKKYSMPYRISDFGIPIESFTEYFERIKNSSAIDDTNEDECKRFEEALLYFWDIK